MPRLAEALLAALFAGNAVAADNVACHLTYGGQTQIVEATPVASPYSVAPIEIGSYLLFRIVFRNQPADLASIKLYAYANHDDGRPPIHQATYAYPPAHDREHGFTGLIRVYEPRYGGELEYWCELRKAL